MAETENKKHVAFLLDKEVIDALKSHCNRCGIPMNCLVEELIADACGIDIPLNRRQKLTPSLKRRIFLDYCEGTKRKDLVEKYGLSNATIGRVIRSYSRSDRSL